jgi:DNA-binding NtrC family response regulator
MKPTAVLVLGTRESKGLIEVLFDVGFTPIVRQRMQAVLEKLRPGLFAAIIVDRNHVDVDVLEFVLNVRDIDEQTPIVVIGQATDTQNDQALLSQRRIFLLCEFDAPDRLANELEQVLTVGETQDS